MRWIYALLSDYSETDYEKEYKEMTESRKARVDRLSIEEDRKRSLLGEILIKKLLCEEGIKATLESDSSGRPYLSGAELYVSIAHSGEMAICAISENPVGIDVERIKPINLKLINKVCTEREKAYVEKAQDPSLSFLEIWTAKEAYFKKHGTGITNLKSVDILSLERELRIINGYFIQIVY